MSMYSMEPHDRRWVGVGVDIKQRAMESTIIPFTFRWSIQTMQVSLRTIVNKIHTILLVVIIMTTRQQSKRKRDINTSIFMKYDVVIECRRSMTKCSNDNDE